MRLDIKYLLFLLFALCLYSLNAQNRAYKVQTIDELREKHQYGEKPKEEIEESRGEMQSISVLPIFNSTFFIVLGVLLISFLVFLFLGNKSGILFKKEQLRKDSLEFEELSIQDTKISELELLLENALTQKNYKVAIRALYLLTLKHLAETSLIQLRENKTNYDYFHEIKNGNTKQLFKSITTVYDYVWYGEFEAQSSHYQSAADLYRQLQKK